MIYGKKLFSKLRAYVKEKNEEDYDHGELSIGNPMEHVRLVISKIEEKIYELRRNISGEN